MPKVGNTRKLRVVVTGRRDYKDYSYINMVMDLFVLSELGKSMHVLIYGVATGADTLCYEWATSRNIITIPFPVTKKEWNRLGRAAGPIRNRRMIVESRPDVCIAFPGNTGTANMIKQCYELGVPVTLAEEIMR